MNKLFFSAYAFVFLVCAVEPYDREVWWAENFPILLLVAAIAWTARHHRFSAASWGFMLCLPVLHTIGGHYTFALVPFDFVTDTFGFERNHFDRLSHFSVGFFAFPLVEILRDHRLVASAWILYLFPVTAIMALAGVYEIFEWQYALSADPTAGAAVLGSQGDIWDAQKDILADTLGALFAVLAFRLRRNHKQ